MFIPSSSKTGEPPSTRMVGNYESASVDYDVTCFTGLSHRQKLNHVSSGLLSFDHRQIHIHYWYVRSRSSRFTSCDGVDAPEMLQRERLIGLSNILWQDRTRWPDEGQPPPCRQTHHWTHRGDTWQLTMTTISTVYMTYHYLRSQFLQIRRGTC